MKGIIMDTYEQARADGEQLAAFHSPLTDGKSIHEDDMFSEFVSDTPTDMENTPVNDKLDDLIVEVRMLNEMLAPIAPIIAALPELMGKVGPLIEGIEKSPVLKMLGVNLGKKP